LAHLPKLKILLLSETAVTGATLSAFAKASALRELYLDQNSEVRQYLSSLTDLKLSVLSLAKDKLTDQDLDTICRIRTLTYLSLNDDNQISDKGLLKLAQLPHLNFVLIRNCNVTRQGIHKFKLLKPNCEIGGLEGQRLPQGL